MTTDTIPDEGSGAAGSATVYLEDTSGVSTDRFVLQWDTGTVWNPVADSEIFSTLAGMFWTWYRDMVAVQIWVLDWVLGMDWLDWVLSPLAGIGLIVQGMVSQIGLLSLTLIVLAFVVGFWLLKGRYAGGFMELIIGCIIAALATGFLADPMRTFGGQDGMIMQSRDAGMDIATGFATDGAAFQRDAEVIREGLKGQLVDTLIRVPHQIVNYGAKIDGSPCEDVYTDVVGTDDAVERLGDCDERYGEAAGTIDASKVIPVLSLLSTGFVFLLLSVVIVGGTLFAVVLLGWSAIKLLWQLPVGVVSSGTRAQLFRTFASIGLGCILVAMATMFLVAWMKMLLGFYDATSGMPFLVRLYLFNTLVVAGAVFYVLMGASIRAALRGLADKLATTGVPSQVGEPQKMPWDAQARAKWAERYAKAKDWAGVGLGPGPAPAPEKNTKNGNAKTKRSGKKAETTEPVPEPVPAKGQPSPERSGPENNDAPVPARQEAGEWTAAAAKLNDDPVAGRESDRLKERIASAASAVSRTAAGAATGGPAGAAVSGSAALVEGAARRRRERPSTAVVPAPYMTGRRAHIPSNLEHRRESLLGRLRSRRRF